MAPPETHINCLSILDVIDLLQQTYYKFKSSDYYAGSWYYGFFSAILFCPILVFFKSFKALSSSGYDNL